ncbi:FMN-binding protein [Amycolatopsis sp. cmx-11-51]|uniref:FMN-binding protein n=1 Tax=unclassified Amycolatopsis TaxID=2618356 RepID=UPI0039E5F080
MAVRTGPARFGDRGRHRPELVHFGRWRFRRCGAHRGRVGREQPVRHRPGAGGDLARGQDLRGPAAAAGQRARRGRDPRAPAGDADRIDTVSGATSTSESYVNSLQAALDAR